MDDRRASIEERRWLPANYALKVLAGLLDDSDTLFIQPLHARQLGPYRGRDGINEAIAALGKFENSEHSTPYEPVGLALNELIKRPESEKWFIVITDGAFDESAPNGDMRNRDKAIKAGVRTAFILIQQTNRNVAEAWKKDTGAKLFEARNVKEIDETIRNAGAWLNGQSIDKIDIKTSGNNLLINSIFPLRRLTLYQKDASAATLDKVIISGQVVSEQLKQYEIRPIKKLSYLNVGRIYHIRNPDGRIMEPGVGAITLSFSKDVSKLDLLVLPDVAARFDLTVVDSQGIALKADSSGIATICERNYRLIGSLLDDNNKSLLSGRSDLARFKVEAQVDGKIFPLNENGGVFTTEMVSGPPGKEVSIVASAAYAGYFQKTSSPIKLRFADCKRAIEMKVIDGVDKNGNWNSSIDKLELAKALVLSVNVDGKPASAIEMARWKFDFGPNGSSVESRFEDGKLHLRPRPFCCLWWWKEVGPGELAAPVRVTTGSSYDTINVPSNLSFSIDAPSGTWERIRWYGCPFGVLTSIAAVLWYLMRLLRKSRFKPDARFETEEESLTTGSIHPRLFMLREQASATMRWLWPSRAESAELFGIRFTSSGDDVIADGRCLTKEHKIPGWNFDRSRLAANKAKGLPQDDATMSNNMVMKIEMGEIVKTVRYRL